MSWLRNLFGTQPEQPATSRHLGVLVRGTLWHAESAVSQLKMQGIEDGMTGVASVFGMQGRGLEAQIEERRWVSLSALHGRWILIIPEDAYARYRSEFDRIFGAPLDGRVQSTGALGGFDLLNVSQPAVERLCALIARMPPLPPATDDSPLQQAEAPPPQTGRVTVGTCSACGRDLRVKAHAVRPTLHLTCKCGAKNTVTVATGQAAKPSSDGAA